MKISLQYFNSIKFLRMYKQRKTNYIVYNKNKFFVAAKLVHYPMSIDVFVYDTNTKLIKFNGIKRIMLSKKDYNYFYNLDYDRFFERMKKIQQISAKCFSLGINLLTYDRRDCFIIYLEAANPESKFFIKYQKAEEFLAIVREYDIELWQEIIRLFVFDFQTNNAGNIIFWGDLNAKLFVKFFDLNIYWSWFAE